MSVNHQDIFKRIQQGDLHEFEKVFREYYSLLCYYSIQFVKEKEIAEDIVQDLFCQVWENREKLEVHTSLKAYLYRATYLNSLQYIRKQGVHSQYEEYIKSRGVNASLYNESFDKNEIQQIIQRTMESLPVRCSQIFRMSRFEGLKYHEIAKKLSISVKTVEANMGRALKDFRKGLKDYTGILLF